MRMENMKELENGTKVFYPTGTRLGSTRMKEFVAMANFLQSSFKKKVWAVFVNPSQEGKIDNINFVFLNPVKKIKKGN